MVTLGGTRKQKSMPAITGRYRAIGVFIWTGLEVPFPTGGLEGGSATQASRYSRINRLRSTELARYHPPFAAGVSNIDCTRDGWVRCDREAIRTIVDVEKAAKLHRCVCCWRRVVHENRLISPGIGKGCCRSVATER